MNLVAEKAEAIVLSLRKKQQRKQMGEKKSERKGKKEKDYKRRKKGGGNKGRGRGSNRPIENETNVRKPPNSQLHTLNSDKTVSFYLGGGLQNHVVFHELPINYQRDDAGLPIRSKTRVFLIFFLFLFPW